MTKKKEYDKMTEKSQFLAKIDKRYNKPKSKIFLLHWMATCHMQNIFVCFTLRSNKTVFAECHKWRVIWDGKCIWLQHRPEIAQDSQAVNSHQGQGRGGQDRGRLAEDREAKKRLFVVLLKFGQNYEMLLTICLQFAINKKVILQRGGGG